MLEYGGENKTHPELSLDQTLIRNVLVDNPTTPILLQHSPVLDRFRLTAGVPLHGTQIDRIGEEDVVQLKTSSGLTTSHICSHANALHSPGSRSLQCTAARLT